MFSQRLCVRSWLYQPMVLWFHRHAGKVIHSTVWNVSLNVMQAMYWKDPDLRHVKEIIHGLIWRQLLARKVKKVAYNIQNIQEYFVCLQ